MGALYEESPGEKHAVSNVQAELCRLVESGELTREEVGNRLGLNPQGVSVVMIRTLTFVEAYRIASALGIDFALALEPAPMARARRHEP